ncbi:MAG TPA: hypothetical protein VE134_03555, partial [Methanomicrobiales archaeon]|nr:hypothetical protein [Methanomicrobiales archaeon]
WAKSPWYHTKIVGDALAEDLYNAARMDFGRSKDDEFYHDLYRLGVDTTNRWITRMSMAGWYPWETSLSLQNALARQDAIERGVMTELFGSG